MKFPKQAADETGATSRNSTLSAEKTLKQRNLLHSLERGIERRDAEIERLTQEIDSEQRVAEALRKTIDKSQQRISDLEQGIEERMAKCRELRDALKVERERADAAEHQLQLRDNPETAASTPKTPGKVPTLEALMDDDSYMRETLVLDEDAEEELAASTSLPKVSALDSELVAPELIFPGDEDDTADHRETTADAAADVELPAARNNVSKNTASRLAIVLDEGTTPIRHPIYKASMTIGRSRHADIQIASDFISRVHAHIVTDDEGSSYVEDAGSKNGVRVNDERIEGKHAIVHGDSVRLGRVEFKIVDLTLDEDTAP